MELVEWQCLSTFLSGLTGGWSLGAVHSWSDLVSSPGGRQSCNWCCCLTVLLPPEHPRPLYCNLCIYPVPNPPALCRPVGTSWASGRTRILLSKEVPELSPFSKPWSGADAPPTSGLSLLQFPDSVSLPRVGHWGWERESGCFLSFPLSCKKLCLSLQTKNNRPLSVGVAYFLPFPWEAYVHLQQRGCPLGTTAASISQQAPWLFESVFIWILIF